MYIYIYIYIILDSWLARTGIGPSPGTDVETRCASVVGGREKRRGMGAATQIREVVFIDYVASYVLCVCYLCVICVLIICLCVYF